MKNPKETNNQVITENNLSIDDGIITEKPSEDSDLTWDDNKQHTEQHFF